VPQRPFSICTSLAVASEFFLEQRPSFGSIPLGMLIASNPINGVGQSPTTVYAFGVIATLAASGDLRWVLRGGGSNAQHLARHLWRLCLALLIACGSLFLGQPQLFSAAVHASQVLFLPELFALGALTYWMIRVRVGKKYQAAAHSN